MHHPLNPVNALAILLLVLGTLLFNHSLTAWQFAMQTSPSSLSSSAPVGLDESVGQGFPAGSEIRNQGQIQGQGMRQAVLLRITRYFGAAIFLIFLGIQMLLKRLWACHFFSSIRQLAQLALLLIPLSTLIILSNSKLVDSLSNFYLEFTQDLMRQVSTSPDVSRQTGAQGLTGFGLTEMRRAIQISFWVLALLGMGISGLILRLSSRCLDHRVREALHERSPGPGRLSLLLLCLPAELLIVFLLAVYGIITQLFEIVLSFRLEGGSFQVFPLLLSGAAFYCFALVVLQLSNRKMQKASTPEQIQDKDQRLKRAVRFCALAYGIQLLQSGLLPLLGGDTAAVVIDNASSQLAAAMNTAEQQVASLANILLLLTLGLLYSMLLRSEQQRLEARVEKKK